MIAIVNVSTHDLPTGWHEYELRINYKVIAKFQHKREDGLTKCLERASEAASGRSGLTAGLSCNWTEDNDGFWSTECGNMFEITEGTPMQNKMKFCCYCGKPLNQIDYVWHGCE